MKKIIAAAALAITATAVQAETARVVDYNTGNQITISRNDIDSTDLMCIARLSVVRDFLFNTGQGRSQGMRELTDAQDAFFLKYDFTVPTRWIDAEKAQYLRNIQTLTPKQIEDSVAICL